MAADHVKIGIERNSKYMLIVGLFALGVYWFTLPNDNQAIRTTLESLRALAEVDKKLVGLEIAEKAGRISYYMSEEVQIEMRISGRDRFSVLGRRKFKDKLLMAYSQLDRAEVQLRNLDIEIEAGSATVEGELSFLGSLTGNDETFLEMHKVEITLKEVEGDWLISRLSHLENLRDP